MKTFSQVSRAALATFLTVALLQGCDSKESRADSTDAPGSVINTIERKAAKTITWRDLEPADFDPQAVFDRYAPQLEAFEDGDLAAVPIYDKIMEELNNAPVNAEIKGDWIRLPGFIAPLEVRDGAVWEFLLVPYFGACIHVPPPPVNQTVFVTVAEGQEIPADTAYMPIWVSGQMNVERLDKEIGVAGYAIEAAMIEPYEDEQTATQ